MVSNSVVLGTLCQLYYSATTVLPRQYKVRMLAAGRQLTIQPSGTTAMEGY